MQKPQIELPKFVREKLAHLGTGQPVELDTASVMPFKDQPRKQFLGIAKLGESIRYLGQLTPILVTPLEPPVDGYRYMLVDGERRLEACKQANVKVLAVVDRSGDLTDERRFMRSVAANFCRQGHDVVEVVRAIRRLLKSGLKRKAVATIFGKSEAWVAQHMILVRLDRMVFAMMQRGSDGEKPLVSLQTGLLLSRMKPELQRSVAKWIRRGRPSFVATQNYVHQVLDAARTTLPGSSSVLHDGFRKRHPVERREQFRKGVTRCLEVSRRWATGEHALQEARQLVDGGKGDLRERLAADCRELSEHFGKLADILK